MAAIDVEPADYIQLDIFPGELYLDTKEGAPIGDQYRIIVTNNYLYVIEDTINGPQPTIKSPISSFEGTNKIGYTVDTPDGVYYVKRAQNCGCGSRLRGIHPFAGVPFISQLSKK